MALLLWDLEVFSSNFFYSVQGGESRLKKLPRKKGRKRGREEVVVIGGDHRVSLVAEKRGKTLGYPQQGPSSFSRTVARGGGRGRKEGRRVAYFWGWREKTFCFLWSPLKGGGGRGGGGSEGHRPAFIHPLQIMRGEGGKEGNLRA